MKHVGFLCAKCVIIIIFVYIFITGYLSNVRREDDKIYLVHAVEMNELMAAQPFTCKIN